MNHFEAAGRACLPAQRVHVLHGLRGVFVLLMSCVSVCVCLRPFVRVCIFLFVPACVRVCA